MRTIGCVIALTLSIFFFAGCATGPGRVEMDYSTSYKLAKFGQTLNPDADRNLNPVTGLDGSAAQKAYEQHIKSFEKPDKQPVLQLGIIGQGSR